MKDTYYFQQGIWRWGPGSLTLLQLPKAAEFSCPSPPAAAEGGRSGSKLTPKHTPALQHSAQSSLWDGHSTMSNFPMIQVENAIFILFNAINVHATSGGDGGPGQARAGCKVSSINTILYWPAAWKKGNLARRGVGSVNFSTVHQAPLRLSSYGTAVILGL